MIKINKMPLVNFLAAGFFFLSSLSASALPTGDREIANFEREALNCARDLFKLPGQFTGNDYEIELNNQIVHDLHIKRARIIFSGLDKRDLGGIMANGFDFSTLRKTDGIEVEGLIEISAIKALINREISRVSAGRRIFDELNVNFAGEKIRLNGKVDLQKIPGNPFLFLPQQMSPFAVNLSVKAEGNQLSVEISEGEMNNQPLTPELIKMLHDWLNPLWDFNALPYPASLNYLSISTDGINFRGSLFK